MEYKLSLTETLSINTKPIDKLPLNEALVSMIDSNFEVIKSISTKLDEIEKIILIIFDRLSNSIDGRLIYAGAGTSGRIGVQDGVELYPTFGWPKERVGFLLAGGELALIKSVENAEDNIEAAKKDVKNLSVNKNDILFGLAASGNTPYTKTVIREARKLGALTIGISNNPDGIILKTANIGLCLNTKSELIAGSTRLKAGTSQKICLNIISSFLMIKMKRVQDGQMTHLVATNEKLRDRQKRIQNNKN
tara:strand:- start:114 stop:860 length:747 start_codon:yes stop_codon:yes gene_type:complete